MLYSMKINMVTYINRFERRNTHDFGNETLPFSVNPDILLIGCCKDIEWIESVLIICQKLTPICQIDQKQKSIKVLNSENITAIIYIASSVSQQSQNLQSMLESLNQSKYFPEKVFTVVRDQVIAPDMFQRSKQTHVSKEQKECLPDLIDTIARTGMFCIYLYHLYVLLHHIDITNTHV